MITLECENLRLQPPKTDRCLLDSRDRYTLVLQNNYTKDLFVYKAIDGEGRWRRDPLRFDFTVPVREGMTPGEYTCYVCSFDKWSRLNLDSNLVEQSYIDEYDIVTFGGIGITDNGYILVNKKAHPLVHEGEAIIINGQVLAGEIAYESGPYGELYRQIEIICSTVVKLRFDDYKTLQHETGYEDNYRQPRQ